MKTSKYLLNTPQEGEALELLISLEDKSVDLVFLDPQYEKAGGVSRVKDWPIHYQSEYQIIGIIKEINRILKPSAFLLLWVNKGILRTDRIFAWLLQASKLEIVDFLVWSKNHFGFGSYFRSKGEFAYLIQKTPVSSNKFVNKSFPGVWTEGSVADKNKKHLHQKPKELIKTLILATTNEKDLIVDPCAGSFIVLEACQETNRQFLGVDLTFTELQDEK